jgi:hypothetical protein
MAKKIKIGHFCVNNESPIDVKFPHVMHCISCYSRVVGHAILEQKKS